MSDEHEHDHAARQRARALAAQQRADQQQARRQCVVERVGKDRLPAPPAGPQADRRLDEAMHKISNAASTANAVWLPALQAQLRMGNLDGFEKLYTQTTRDIASAERGLNLLERAMLHDADPSEHSDVEARLAVQHQTMLAQLIPVHNELRTLRVEADAAVARAAKGGPAAAPPMLATSASELDFGTVAIGEVSRPVTVTFANTSARFLAIDAVAVSAAGGSRSGAVPFRLGAADTRKAHLMPGEEMDLTVYFEPTTAMWPHAWLQVKASDGPVHIVRDVSLRGSTQPASASSAGARPVDAQNRAQQASDALVAGATPAVGTSADMLAAVLAAQTLTQQDTKASRQHADAILTELLARLAALRPIAVQRLAKEGSALNVFGAAADALDEWQAQLGVGARVATPVLVRRFQLAHEPLQFVLGETHDLPTLRPLYKAAPLSALAITGGVFMGGLLAAGALPIVASEASVLSFGGRMVAQRLVAWGAANPALALATTEMVIGFAVSVDPADYTWANLCEVFSDPKSAVMFLAQMLMDIMHLRMAGHSDSGMSPAPRRGAPAGGEPAALPTGRNTGARPAAPGTSGTALAAGAEPAAPTLQPTNADYAILRQRVQKLIAVRDDVARKANASLPPVRNTNEPVRPAPPSPTSVGKLPAQASQQTPAMQPTAQELAAQEHALDQQRQPAHVVGASTDAEFPPKFEKNQGELLPSRSDLAQDGGLQSTEGTRVRTLNGSLAPPSHVLLEHGPDVPLSKLRHSIEDGTKRTASKFIDRATMERTILGVLNSNEATITTWLANQPAPGRNLALNSTSDYGLIGVGFQKTASGIEARYDLRSATVVIKSTGHGNYVIQTAFPR